MGGRRGRRVRRPPEPYGGERVQAEDSESLLSLIRGMDATHVREDSGDFRLMSRRALDALNQLREQHRFIRGMVGWVGFRTAEVHYDRKARVAGVTKYPFRKMLRFAIDAPVSFSSFPLRLAYVLSSSLSLILCAYLVYTVFMHFFFDRTLSSRRATTQEWRTSSSTSPPLVPTILLRSGPSGTTAGGFLLRSSTTLGRPEYVIVGRRPPR